MHARGFVLAAGRGARLRPFTDETPKPLLEVGGRRLIEWHLAAFGAGGVSPVVVNTCWLEEQFAPALGDGSRWGIQLVWSHERERFGAALDTAGGVRAALDRMDEVFWVVSADMWLPGFRFTADEWASFAASDESARLWLALNPSFHPRGDFAMGPHGRATLDLDGPRGTWAGVGLFRREMFSGLPLGQACPLRDLLQSAVAENRVGLRWLDGAWVDVGTPERWEAARLMQAG